MQDNTIQGLLFGVALALVFFVLLPDCAALPTARKPTPGAPEEFLHHHGGEGLMQTTRELQVSVVVQDGSAVEQPERTFRVDSHEPGESDGEVPETDLIQPIDIPFKDQPHKSLQNHTGISLIALGEPKSGTTWIGRVIVELCVQMCGNPENTWCKMGGLKMTENRPAPYYDFEMLHADTDELFLHFEGKKKHLIPGLGQKGCIGKTIFHRNGFAKEHPCMNGGVLSRVGLRACLPDVTPECAMNLAPLDPARRRIVVIFRDARNLIISEHRMKRGGNYKDVADLESFILDRFQIVVAWIHQRYVWHTTALKEVTHVVFYEDLQTHPRHLADLAEFMGLDCTPEEAEDVFQRHIYAEPPGDYTTYGLSSPTLEWMNATMSWTLPEAMLTRYGLSPT